eukprot:Amastigsp_a340160_18.p3 type:complete len:132 gc:universal Amastigsp_a340160_18:397-792(+)
MRAVSHRRHPLQMLGRAWVRQLRPLRSMPCSPQHPRALRHHPPRDASPGAHELFGPTLALRGDLLRDGSKRAHRRRQSPLCWRQERPRAGPFVLHLDDVRAAPRARRRRRHRPCAPHSQGLVCLPLRRKHD